MLPVCLLSLIRNVTNTGFNISVSVEVQLFGASRWIFLSLQGLSLQLIGGKKTNRNGTRYLCGSTWVFKRIKIGKCGRENQMMGRRLMEP